jgi:hypothetical protein
MGLETGSSRPDDIPPAQHEHRDQHPDRPTAQHPDRVDRGDQPPAETRTRGEYARAIRDDPAIRSWETPTMSDADDTRTGQHHDTDHVTSDRLASAERDTGRRDQPSEMRTRSGADDVRVSPPARAAEAPVWRPDSNHEAPRGDHAPTERSSRSDRGVSGGRDEDDTGTRSALGNAASADSGPIGARYEAADRDQSSARSHEDGTHLPHSADDATVADKRLGLGDLGHTRVGQEARIEAPDDRVAGPRTSETQPADLPVESREDRQAAARGAEHVRRVGPAETSEQRDTGGPGGVPSEQSADALPRGMPSIDEERRVVHDEGGKDVTLSVLHLPPEARTAGDDSPVGTGLKPTGEQLLRLGRDNPAETKANRLLDKAFDNIDDLHDSAAAVANTVEFDLTPPTGHDVTHSYAVHDRPSPSPEAPSPGDAIGNITVLGVMTAVSARYVIRRYLRGKQHRDS